jgi:putative transposase
MNVTQDARREGIEAQISISAVGNPYNNAKAESFFKTLKQEEVYPKEYDSFCGCGGKI